MLWPTTSALQPLETETPRGKQSDMICGALQPLRWQCSSKTWECFGLESPSVSEWQLWALLDVRVVAE